MRWISWSLLVVVIMIQGACATSSERTNHAFSFDSVWDSPDIFVLDYRYGKSKLFASRARDSTVMAGVVRQTTNINGDFLRGDFLYVKWRTAR